MIRSQQVLLSSHITDGIVKVPAIDIISMIVESRGVLSLTLNIPADIFDAEYTLAAFSDRMRELGILELVRAKRMHEHEALELLGIERRELLEKMRACGIMPTESAFEKIKGELDQAIKTRIRR